MESTNTHLHDPFIVLFQNTKDKEDPLLILKLASVHTRLCTGSRPDTTEAHRLRASSVPTEQLYTLVNYEQNLSRESEAPTQKNLRGHLSARIKGETENSSQNKRRQRLSKREQRADSETR